MSVKRVSDLQDKKYWLVPALPLILMDFMNIKEIGNELSALLKALAY